MIYLLLVLLLVLWTPPQIKSVCQRQYFGLADVNDAARIVMLKREVTGLIGHREVHVLDS